jgi:hypothetical protein
MLTGGKNLCPNGANSITFGSFAFGIYVPFLSFGLSWFVKELTDRTSGDSFPRIQRREFLLQQIDERERIETIEKSPASGEDVREQRILAIQKPPKLSQDARFASAHTLLRNLQHTRNRALICIIPKEPMNEPLIFYRSRLKARRRKYSMVSSCCLGSNRVTICSMGCLI